MERPKDSPGVQTLVTALAAVRGCESWAAPRLEAAHRGQGGKPHAAFARPSYFCRVPCFCQRRQVCVAA